MAGPPAPRPATTLARLRRELESGWPAGLTVLVGDDLYHLDAAQRALVEALVPGEAREWGLTVFGEQRIDVSEVVAAARSAGMFASRRVVLVRDVNALEGEPDALADYAAAPPAESYLLVRAPALDRRRKLHQALGRLGRSLSFTAAGPADGREVAELAAGKQLELSREAADLLADLCAGDYYRIDAELEKIRTWLGAEPRRAGADVVREIAAGSALLSGWEVADALLVRDRAAALAAVRRLVQAGDEPLRILGGLAWRMRTLLVARALVEGGRRPEQALAEARWFGARRAALEALQRWRLDELLAVPAWLHEADFACKSRSLDPRVVLEQLVDRLSPPRTAAAGGRRT